MSAWCRGGGGAAVAALLWTAALLAACQPLPRPFADDKPPPGLLSVRDSVGVTVAPIDGEPRVLAAKLGAATAKALLQRDIAATDKTTSPGSNQLYGRIDRAATGPGKVTMTATWRLRNNAGKMIGERTDRVEASVTEWEQTGDEVLARLAAESAAGLAALMQDEPAVEAAAGTRRTRMAVRKITGAPGDGSKSLAAAAAAVLKQLNVETIEEAKGKPDLYLDAEITVTPVKPDKQHVKIVWRLSRADGAEIGTVGQENDVPRGMLDGPWGDLAYNIAIAAGDGLAQLIARGGPAPRGSS